MNLLIVGDMFSLASWLMDDREPEIMPAVYEFYQYLGSHDVHRFEAHMVHPKTSKTVSFPNGSAIHIHRLAVPVHYLRKWISLRFLKRKCQESLAERKYDAIYGMSIYAIVAKQLGSTYRILSVGRIFGSLIWDVLQKNQRIKACTRHYYQLQEAYRPCDITICTEDGTEFDKALAQTHARTQLYMLYNGMNEELRNQLIQLDPVSYISSKEKIRMIYIARLTDWKRQDLAIELVALLHHQYGLQLELDIYGVGENHNKLLRLIQKKGMKDIIQLKGSIQHNLIPSLLEAYEVSMFFYEASNLGNAMWESAIAGRYILTRDTGKTSEIFNTTNALVMHGDNIQQLADDFIQSMDRHTDLGLMARATVDNLLTTWRERLDYEMDIIQKYISNQTKSV